MIGTVGDLVEDIAVRMLGPLNIASDTPTHIHRRRGGSAANTSVAIARAGHPSRFIGQIGDDPLGDSLLQALVDEGVDAVVRREGRSGTIVVLVDQRGERTMLTDRAACADLADPDRRWLDGLHTLHVPLYSLIDGELAQSAQSLIRWSHERGITVSVDASSAAVIQSFGPSNAYDLIRRLQPTVLLCNELECDALGGRVALSDLASIVVVKCGPDPAWVISAAGTLIVAVPPGAPVVDTTGAGDAFAAGFLISLSGGAAPEDAALEGHRTARVAIDLLAGAG